MTEVISVRFRGGCKNYYFDPKGVQVKMGDQVIVETAQGPEFATCTEGNHEVDDESIVKPLCAMLRTATENDRRTVEYNKKRENEAFDICEKKIADHGLEMKLVNVSASFDGNKIIFYFTADGRVDFRELVRDLASVFRARIELRQIGVRDEAKMIGGLGICGRPFCCSSFLNDFHPVSIKMAKTQNLSLNPTKISGTCGRLMCCLKYEQDAYTDLLKRAPKQDSLVETPEGVGVVNQVNLLRETCKVTLDNDPDTPRFYKNSELTVIRSGKGKRPAGYEKPEESASPAPRPLRKEPPKQEPAAEPLPEETEVLPEEENTAPVEEEKPARPPRQPRQRRPQEPKHSEAKPEGESREQRPRRPRPPRPQQSQKQEESGPAPQPKEEGQSGEQRRPRPHYRKHRPHARRPEEGGQQPQAPKSEG